MHRTVTNEFPWGVIEWFSGAEVGNSSELSVAKTLLLAGGVTETHLHDNCEEAVYVISGSISCVVDGADHQLVAGDHTVVPRGAKHQLCNPGTGPAELILSYSSATRDFTVAQPEGADSQQRTDAPE